MTTRILTPLDQLWERVAALEREVVLLRRGGCTCECPRWHRTGESHAYCAGCSAIVAVRLLPEKERPR